MRSEVLPKPASPGNTHHSTVYYKSGPPPRSCATFAHLLTPRACDTGFDALSSCDALLTATLASLAAPPLPPHLSGYAFLTRSAHHPHSLRSRALSPSRALAFSPSRPCSLDLSQVSP
jgi:hypothetical protein